MSITRRRAGFFPTVGTCCQTGPREVTFPLAPGTVVDVRTPLALCQTGPREVTFPLRPGTVVLTMKWNTMGRLPAAGRILCPLGQGTARPGPELARCTGLARGSYGLHGSSVWEAVWTLAQQVPWHRMLDRVTVVLVRHGNGVSRDGNDIGGGGSWQQIGDGGNGIGGVKNRVARRAAVPRRHASRTSARVPMQRNRPARKPAVRVHVWGRSGIAQHERRRSHCRYGSTASARMGACGNCVMAAAAMVQLVAAA